MRKGETKRRGEGTPSRCALGKSPAETCKVQLSFVQGSGRLLAYSRELTLCVGVLPPGNAPRYAFKIRKVETATQLCHSSTRDLRQQFELGIVLRSNCNLTQITGATLRVIYSAQTSKHNACVYSFNFPVNTFKMWIQN